MAIASRMWSVPVSQGVTALQECVDGMCAAVEADGGEVIGVSHAAQSFTPGSEPAWTVLVAYRKALEF